MPAFKFTTNNGSPVGKYKLYLCAHRDDVSVYVDHTQSFLDSLYPNSSLWYYDESSPQELTKEIVQETLSQMKFFVVPVTERFIEENELALNDHLVFATQANIPILFLLQDDDLVDRFNKVFGKLHFIKESDDEYEKKVERFMSFLLADDRLLRRIDKAFESKIFLSYRKQDRVYAKQIIDLIHKYNKYVAIWFDDYLIPGEKFDIKIRSALKNSDFMALVVTPAVLDRPNYVEEKEYPYATQTLKKEVIPFEAVKTDNKTLGDVLKNIGPCIDVTDEESLLKVLENAFSKYMRASTLALDEREYLIGLAYLMGINIEHNSSLGFEMIKNSADAGNHDAMNKLYQMYRVGDFVDMDFKEAIKWKMKSIRKLYQLRYHSRYSYQKKKYGLEFIYSCLELIEYKNLLIHYDHLEKSDIDFIFSSDIIPEPSSLVEKSFTGSIGEMESNLDLFAALLYDRYQTEEILLARARCHYQMAEMMIQYNDPSLRADIMQYLDETLSVLEDNQDDSMDIKLLIADTCIAKVRIMLGDIDDIVSDYYVIDGSGRMSHHSKSPNAALDMISPMYNIMRLSTEIISSLEELDCKNPDNLNVLSRLYKIYKIQKEIFLLDYRRNKKSKSKNEYVKYTRLTIQTAEKLTLINESRKLLLDLLSSYGQFLFEAIDVEDTKYMFDEEEKISVYKKLVALEDKLEERWSIPKKYSKMY